MVGPHRDVVAVIGDRYEIVRELGRGGMGTVHLARDRRDGRVVALKTLPAAAPAVADLAREFAAVSGLRHPSLVELYELHAAAGGCWFTMEWIEGVDPRRWVRGDGAPPPAGALPGPVPLDRARLRETIAQLADGLAFLHAHGVVHRDVKGSNVLVRADGAVKLLDFGIALDARAAPAAPRRAADPLVGTVAYMAPEYLTQRRVGPALDLYALGVLAFELATGGAPFGGSFHDVAAAHVEQRPPRAIACNPVVPEDLDELIARLLVKDPDARPTARDVAARARAA